MSSSSSFLHKLSQTMKATREKIGESAHNLFDAADEAPEELYVPVDHIVMTPVVEEPAAHVGFSWKFWIAGACIVLLSYFVFQSLELLYLILTGLIIAMASEKMIMYMHRRIPRGFAIVFTYLLFVLFVSAGALLVFPFLAQQLAEILSLLIERATGIQEQLQGSDLRTVIDNSNMYSGLKSVLINMIGSGELGQSIQEGLLTNISQIVTASSGYIKNVGDVLVGVVGGFFSGLAQILIVFITAVFFSIEKNEVIFFFQKLGGKAMPVDRVIQSLFHRLGSRLKGQLLLCVFMGISAAIGLNILSLFGIDIPNKLTLSLIVGLTEFIPYVGPILGGVPALMVAAITHGWVGFFAVGLLYALIQQAENNILVPVVMNRAVGVSPLLVFLSMLIWGSLLGILGVLIAVPLAVILDVARGQYVSTHPKK